MTSLTTFATGPRLDLLGRPEQLLVVALRWRAQNEENCARTLAWLFWRALPGARAETVWMAFDDLYRTLVRFGRRPLRSHPAPHPFLSADERVLVGLLAALQARETLWARALLERLAAGGPGRERLAAHARTLADVLIGAGQRLALPPLAAPRIGPPGSAAGQRVPARG